MKKRAYSGRKRGFPTALVLVLGGVMLVCLIVAVTPRGKVAASLTVGDRLPDVRLSSLDGKTVAIPTDLKGKVVLLHFWLSSCSYCVKEMYILESFCRRNKDRGVIAFSINAGEDKQVAERYVAKLNVSYPILLDPGLSTARRYGVSGVPTTYVLDRNGVLSFKIIGEINADQLDKMTGSLF